MIRSLADDETEHLFITGKLRRRPPRLPQDIVRRVVMRLRQLDAATRIEDLRLPASNGLHALGGNLAARYPIRINDQWRMQFRFVDGDAFDVEIVDYH